MQIKDLRREIIFSWEVTVSEAFELFIVVILKFFPHNSKNIDIGNIFYLFDVQILEKYGMRLLSIENIKDSGA